MSINSSAAPLHEHPTPTLNPPNPQTTPPQPQWAASVSRSQRLLGALYEKIYDTMRARGVPPDGESVLWACLARIKDPKTGGGDKG